MVINIKNKNIAQEINIAIILSYIIMETLSNDEIIILGNILMTTGQIILSNSSILERKTLE